MIRVVVAGAGGRMGKETVRAISTEPDMRVVAEAYRGNDLAFLLKSSEADVMVDFTVPEVVLENVRTAISTGVSTVIGTTGLTNADLDEIDTLCKQNKVGALFAPNFAIGAVLLMQFAERAARYFPDVEIMEMHHERKVDAPSGTALRTAALVAAAREAAGGNAMGDAPGSFESAPGARGGKAAGGVPVHSVRLPGFVASEEVIFGSAGQRLTLRHDSLDRTSFMPGVVLAVRSALQLKGLVVGLEHLL